MNYLDIILCIPLIWGLYRGFSRGLIIQLASLLALVLGVYGALLFSDYAKHILDAYFQIDNKYVPLIAFASTFIAIAIGVHFLGKILEKAVNLIALGFFNKIFGAVFGFLKVALVISVVLFIIEVVGEQLPFIPKMEKDKSILYGPMSELIPTMAPDAKKMAKKAKSILV